MAIKGGDLATYSETHLVPEVLLVKIEYWFNFNFGDKSAVDRANVPLSYFCPFCGYNPVLSCVVEFNHSLSIYFKRPVVSNFKKRVSSDLIMISRQVFHYIFWSLMVLTLIFSVDLVGDIMKGIRYQ